MLSPCVVSTSSPLSVCLLFSLFTLFLSDLSLSALRADKESWIRSKYVEKKFIQKLPETGRNPPQRRSSGKKTRTPTQDRPTQDRPTQDRPTQRPPLKPKPNRATLPRVTGKGRETRGCRKGNVGADKSVTHGWFHL